MAYIVDAKGLSCPEPVLLTANALKTHGGETVKVLVSEAYVRENVKKYALSQGKAVTVAENGREFELTIE